MIMHSIPVLQRLFIIPITYEGHPRWFILSSCGSKLGIGFEYWPGCLFIIEVVHIYIAQSLMRPEV